MRCQMKADFVNTAAQRLSGKLRVHSARRNLVCFSPRGDGSAQRQSTRREPGTDAPGRRRVPVSNAQTRIDAENTRRPSGVGDAGSRQTRCRVRHGGMQKIHVARLKSAMREVGEHRCRVLSHGGMQKIHVARLKSAMREVRRTPVQSAQPRRDGENVRRPSEVSDAGSRRTPVQSAQPRRGAENTRRPSEVE